MSNSTDFLYARPSFIEGIARIFDFGNTLAEYNRSESGSHADLRALEADWMAIGQDMKEALLAYEQKQQTQSKT